MIHVKKQGLSSFSTIASIILVIVLVIISITVFGKTLKGSTEILKCKNNGGECRAGTCDIKTQIPALGDKAAGCPADTICCINVTSAKPVPDKGCEDKANVGKTCGDSNLMYCNVAQKCVTKCEFCSKNYKNYKDVCNTFTDSKIDYGYYTCGCTQTQCTTNKCLAGNCPDKTPTATDYMCCDASKNK